MAVKLSKDRTGGVLLLVFFAAYGWLTQDIQLLTAQDLSIFTARTLPVFLAILGVIGAVLLLVLPAADQPQAQPQSLRWSRFFSFLVLMSIYGLTLRPLGFLIATSAFLLCGFLLLGERRAVWLIGVTVFVTAGFWALMSFGLNVYIEPWPGVTATPAT